MLQQTPDPPMAMVAAVPELAPVVASKPGWVRSAVGWALVAVGLVFIPTPIPIGAVFMVFGLALLGPRNRLVRFAAAAVLRSSRRWAHRGSPVARWILAGTLALRHSIQRLRSRARAQK